MEKIAYASDENTTHQLNLQYSNSSDVPRYDRLTEMSAGKPKFAEWKYGPQLRTMMAYDRNRKNKDGFFQTNHIGLNFQHVEESRISRKFNSNNLDRRNENVNVWGATAWAERKNGKQTTVVGGDIYLNFLESTADRTVISTGVLKPLDTRYPNGKNQMNLFGAYLEHRNVLSQKFQTQLGGRLGYSMLSSQLIDSTFFKFPFNAIQQNNLTYSGNLGLVYLTEGVESKNQWKFSFFQSTAFRAPNLDDLAKIFETAKGTLIVPNESLKPEKTWTNDLGINKIGEKLTWETHAYYTLFFDAIVTSPFQYQGKDSVVYDGVLSAVYANQNQRRAFVFGGNCQLTRKPSERLTWNSGINYTKGRIFSGDTTIPLDHIPPLQFSTDVNYHWGKFALRGQVQYQGKKELKDYLLNGEDNEQYATAEGMPAWVVVNLKGRVTLPRGLSVSGGIDNLFDTQYRVFASGINGPGRNLQITIRSTW
jgi:hemoglobin/transferrin/lactoferrin receptor protein